ncbi:MAG: hypothetical protein QCH99_03065 [Candidatus Bathyarchaeota archaeon]|nr:hypothetical protein [Candidatus Bathyarchaeum tardum]WGM88654.1 MAG: hypothetical protein NUK63_06945 [Candidatus Bathyarchaeum tardum]
MNIRGGKVRIDEFINTHLWGKDVDVYCGGPDGFKGKVISAVNKILTLETKKVYTHVTVDKSLHYGSKTNHG